MICPVCQKAMVEQDFGGVKVDICINGCKGLWFDWLEINKLDETNEGFGNALQEALNYPRYNDDNRGPIKCPKCSLPLHRHLFQSEKEINVDECYNCGGFFLDSGELKIIRDKHMSESEREAYESKLLNQKSFYTKGVSDLQESERRTEAVRSFTKFVRLSYYMTGQ